MPFKLLHRLNSHVENQGERNAFFINNTSFSYISFMKRIRAIQQEILENSGEDELFYGLVTFDDLDTYAAIYALWYLGKAYVPLNPANPADRNRSILEQTDIKSILFSGEKAKEPGFTTGMNLIYTSELPDSEKDVKEVDVPDESPCYMIFTSGSTGKPKGVPITRANLGSFVEHFAAAGYDMGPDDRFLQIYDLSFDASVHCYTLPLWTGGCVYTVPRDQIKYLYAYKLMKEQQLTFVKMPPSTLAYLQPYFNSIRLEHLRYCLLGGEAFNTDLALKWSECVPNAQIQNVYGPTEATINTHIFNWSKEQNEGKSYNGVVSIGKCFGENEAVIIDEKEGLLGPHEKGELCLGGRQVTPAYWRNDEQNERAFIQLEVNGQKKRFYRTGDLAFTDCDGDFMFLGRIDSQVQIQGYRVELGEVEKHSRDALGISNVAAIARINASSITEIILFVESTEARISFLQNYLEERLPSYMLPARIIPVEVFPKSVGGKISRSALEKLIADE